MSAPQGSVNPAKSITDAIALCRRPFTTAAVKFKIQTNPKENDPKKRAAVVAFIDARLAGERLNAAGLLWSNRFNPVPGGLECAISVTHPETGQTLIERADVGWARDLSSAKREDEKNMIIKTSRSDAFKRAAVHFGVGVSIYALPIKYLSGQDDEIVQRGRNWYITRKGEKALAAHYEAWLERVGKPQFGEPIDHGDVDGAQGDIESEDRANDEAVVQEASAQQQARTTAADQTQTTQTQNASATETKDERVATEGQINKIVEALAQSTKSIADVQTYLASKGIEGFDSEQSLEQLLGMTLSYEVAKGLFLWLKKAARVPA